MTHLVTLTPPLPGKHAVRRFGGGLGVRGDAIPSTGDSGPAPLYNDVSLPADAAAEFRIELLSLPALGTLAMQDDSSFVYVRGADGADSFTYRAWKNGAAIGVFTVSLSVGGVAAALAGAASDAAGASGALAAAIRLAGAALNQAGATGSLAAAIPLVGPAADQALATGLLTTQIRLAGAALDQVGAVATLTVSFGGLAGAAAAAAGATGNLSSGVVLVGAALGVAAASGEFTLLPIDLAGAAVSLSSAAGQLMARIRLGGAAIGAAVAGGVLSGGAAAVPGVYTFFPAARPVADIRCRTTRPADPTGSYPVVQKSIKWTVGAAARVSGRIVDAAGMPVDPPGVRLLVRTPGGAVTAYAYGAGQIQRDGPGLYRADIVLEAAGIWAYRWDADAPNKGAGEGEIFVAPSRF